LNTIIDILHDNSLPNLDIILAIDILSFVTALDQGRLIASFAEKPKSKGVVLLGANEILPGAEWLKAGKELVSAFVKAYCA
jgi:purine-binding chemotaxis protein CheW